MGGGPMSSVRCSPSLSRSCWLVFGVVLGIAASLLAGRFPLSALAQAEVLDQRVEAEDHAAQPSAARQGQTFTAGVTGMLTRLEIEVRSNASTADLRVELLAVDAQGLPTGSALGAGIIPAGA